MLDTINIVEIPDTGRPNELSITAFPNTDEGKQAATELFKKLANENFEENKTLTKKQLEAALDDGVFDYAGSMVLFQYSRT